MLQSSQNTLSNMIQTESFHFIILNNVKLPLGLNDTKKLPEVTSVKRSTVRMLFGQIYSAG